MANKTPRVFAYIISTVEQGCRLNGSVPWVTSGRVFFGPCKKRMRPLVEKGDYIMGLSPASVGRRRVLLWMKVAEKMTFADAYARGKTDKLFRALRGCAIHVRPAKGVTLKGIYKFEGETLTICYSGIGKERPTEFASKAGSGAMLFVQKKEKP